MSGMEPLMLANMGLSVMQQHAQQKRQNDAARAAYEANMQRVNAKNAADERERLKALKHASAQQRAMFAARGMSPTEGSASAVLQGMQVESDQAAKERKRQRALQDELDDVRHGSDAGLAHLRQNLDAYKLDVAKSYASIAYLKDVEERLTGHLIRIEKKLDIARATRAGGPS